MFLSTVVVDSCNFLGVVIFFRFSPVSSRLFPRRPKLPRNSSLCLRSLLSPLIGRRERSGLMLVGNLSEYRAILPLPPPPSLLCAATLSVFFSRESSFADDSSEYPWNVCSKRRLKKCTASALFKIFSRPAFAFHPGNTDNIFN